MSDVSIESQAFLIQFLFLFVVFLFQRIEAFEVYFLLIGIAGQIPGMTEIKVRIDCLPSSTVDVMLDSTFESAEALKTYSTHPKHVAVADSKVRPYTAVRSCMDYEI